MFCLSARDKSDDCILDICYLFIFLSTLFLLVVSVFEDKELSAELKAGILKIIAISVLILTENKERFVTSKTMKPISRQFLSLGFFYPLAFVSGDSQESRGLLAAVRGKYNRLQWQFLLNTICSKHGHCVKYLVIQFIFIACDCPIYRATRLLTMRSRVRFPILQL